IYSPRRRPPLVRQWSRLAHAVLHTGRKPKSCFASGNTTCERNILERSTQMSNITVQAVRDAEAVPRRLFEEMEAISQKIRTRAHELFLGRGAELGRELDDWLQAERELMWLPDTRFIERENEFQARINVQGLDPKDIRIIAMPNSIILQAEPKSRESKLF